MPNNLDTLKLMNLQAVMSADPRARVMTFDTLKSYVKQNYSRARIMELRPIGVAEHIIDDLIERAKHEIYVESNIFPSEAGKLLYDANS